uniref:LAM_G_DOMAIN domain-containing protein n=1 Tax=Macrostomum lignano TaxID=282301 RepID=A0A1I8F9K6_9PLAT
EVALLAQHTDKANAARKLQKRRVGGRRLEKLPQDAANNRSGFFSIASQEAALQPNRPIVTSLERAPFASPVIHPASLAALGTTPHRIIDTKATLASRRTESLRADAFRKRQGSDGRAGSGRLGLARQRLRDAPPNGGPFSWSLVTAVATATWRLRVNINFGHLVKAEEQQSSVQACDGGQRTLCAPAKLFVRTVRGPADASLLPSKLDRGARLPGSRSSAACDCGHPSPKDARLRLLSHSDLFSLAPNGELSVAMATTPPDGLHRVRVSASSRGLASEQEVRVRVTLLTEAMAESAVPLQLGGGSAHGFFLDRRDAQLAEQLTAQLRLGADARVLLLARLWGGERAQRQLMALLAVYEESRRGFLDPAEVRSRLNSSEAVRSLLPEGGGGLRLGGGGSAGPAAAGGDGRDHLHGAGVPAVERRAAVWRRLRLLSGRLGGRRRRRLGAGGAQQLRGLELRLRTRQSRRGASCGSPAAAAGGWRCGLHADGDGRLEATAAVSGGGGTEDRDGPELLRLVRPAPVNDGAWHRVLLRLHDGSPYWTLELLTDSIEPQLGQLPALPASSPSSWDGAGSDSASRTGPICRLPHRPAVLAGGHPTDGSGRLRLRPRLGAGCPRPSWRPHCASTPCQHEGVCTEVGGRSAVAALRAALTAGPRCELNLRPCDHRPCPERRRLPGLRPTGARADSPATARLGRPDRAASWWTAAAAEERRPHLVEVEAPANTAAGAWAAAAAARAPAMLGRCATATSTSADRPSGCAMAARRLRQPAGRVQVRVSSGSPDRPRRAAPCCPANPGAAIDGGALRRRGLKQPLLLGLRFTHAGGGAGLRCSSLLPCCSRWAVFLPRLLCYGKRRRGAAQARRREAAACCQDDPGEEAMALMPMMAPPMDQRQLRRPGGLADVRRLRDAAAAAANAAVNAGQAAARGLRALPVLLRLAQAGAASARSSPQKPVPPCCIQLPALLRRRRSGGRGFSGRAGYHWDLSSPEQAVPELNKTRSYHWNRRHVPRQSLAQSKTRQANHWTSVRRRPCDPGRPWLGPASRGPATRRNLIMDGGPFQRYSFTFGGRRRRAKRRQRRHQSAFERRRRSTSAAASARLPLGSSYGCRPAAAVAAASAAVAAASRRLSRRLAGAEESEGAAGERKRMALNGS